MTEKRYNRLVSSIDYYYCTDNQNENQGLTEKDMLNRLNEQDEELQNLKNQIKIYELFLDQNDLNIEWDLFCTLNHCVNDEDTGCQTCKYMGLVDSDSDD